MQEGPPSRHRAVLRDTPLLGLSPALDVQRRMLLYGPLAREAPEDATERRAREELRAALFAGELVARHDSRSG
jgi:mediator of RNA polymerase II transcription subunit 12